MVMWQYYIQAPQIFQPITILKGGVIVEKLDPNSIPADYRKNRLAELKSAIYDIQWILSLIFKRARKETKNDY